MTSFHLHLVSDSTGDTVHAVARACLVQFEGAEAIEHFWSMIRTKTQIERVVHGVSINPGVVLFTLVNDALRAPLVDGCRKLQIPVIPVLEPVIGALAAHLGLPSRGLSQQPSMCSFRLGSKLKRSIELYLSSYSCIIIGSKMLFQSVEKAIRVNSST